MTKDEMGGYVARMGEIRSAYKNVVLEPEGKRSFGTHKRRWEDNIKINLRENGVSGCGLD
jgi:hypothetical protein